MGDSLLVRFSEVLADSQKTNWFGRVAENSRAMLSLRKLARRLPNKAALFEILEFKPRPRSRSAQGVSVLAHAVACAAVFALVVSVPPKPPHNPLRLGRSAKLLPPLLVRNPTDAAPKGGPGSGGGENPLPPTAGQYAQRSPILLLPPRLPDGQSHLLPVEPTLLDESAQEPVNHVLDLGLPSMKDRINSAGPGGPEGIGLKPGRSMGEREGQYAGESGPNGPHAYGISRVQCAYCPDPPYTDAARETKLQGSVTLVVLVTADGKAGQVRMVRGLGLGLDESAMETVRTWRFVPARDGAQHPVAEWVTIEAVYRLF